MKLKEKNQIIYNLALNYLIKILPEQLTEQDLQNYFIGDRRDFSSLSDVYEQLIKSAQNYQRMPNVIKFKERKRELRNILCEYDVNKIAEYNHEELYKIFRKEFNVTSKDNNQNCWSKWSKSVIDAAKFICDFKDVDDFKNFVKQFDYNLHTRMALPLIISSKIKGIGFALACDFLKELGYINYPKPDVHLIDVFSKLGLAEKNPISVFEAIVRMADDCKVIDDSITPYKIDKIIWLICSGRFYQHDIKIPSHKDELIMELDKACEFFGVDFGKRRLLDRF